MRLFEHMDAKIKTDRCGGILIENVNKEDTAEEFSFRRVFQIKGIQNENNCDFSIKNTLQTIGNYAIIIPSISGNLKF